MARLAAQDATVALPQGTVTVLDAIHDIERQTGRIFSYSEDFDLARKISFTTTESSLADAVGTITGPGFSYLFEGRYVIIYDRKANAAQDNVRRFLTAVVLDKASGRPIEGASVEIVRGNASAVTDKTGRFRISGITAGQYIVKITSGNQIRFRQMQAGPDRNANEVIHFEYAAPKAETAVETPRTISSTTYYHRDDTVLDTEKPETPASYSYIPTENLYHGYRPKAAVKTNALWWATTSPNAAVEFSFARKWSADISLVYNPWKLDNVRSRRFWLVQPEARYWFCNVFEKHFLGVHAIGGGYTVGHLDLPFAGELRDHHYDGFMYGAGIAWGYHLPVGKRWGVEFTLGAGWIHFEYDKLRCGECYENLGRYKRDYFGPTKAGISLLFMIK